MTSERPIRQSVSLPARVARRVRTLARQRKTSANRILVDLIEAGLETADREKQRFVELVNRLTHCGDPTEQERLKRELARMTFGD